MKPASAGPEGSNWRDRIVETGPGPAGGALVRATGVAVAEVLRQLAGGASPEEVARRHPGLTEEDVRACLAYAAERPGTADPEVPTKEPAEPGRVAIPGYEVLGELGRGGLGIVYKARQVRLNRVVALKLILAGGPARPELLARLKREAESVARLQHPHVVQVYEAGEHQGQFFLALEHVAGGSLASRLGEEPWPAEEAAGLAETLAEAVQAAHERGVVHRDLKPENVLLTEAGVPKITDFGLAQLLRGEGSALGGTGEVTGTPAYAAPEQAAGNREVGRAADVYGLGAILYRLLTGRPPFEGPTAADTLAQVLGQDPVPVRRLNGNVPRDLETVCMKCLEKEPQRRYTGAGELVEDLRRFLHGEPVKARPTGWATRLWRWARGRPARRPGGESR
jgi:eukaryotic-like serine/threonine-protein kinase